MRSKRSKAWHRRKDEIRRARELIERGLSPAPSTWNEIIARMLTTRNSMLANTLLSASSLIYARRDPGEPATLKFRRWPK